MGIHPGRHSLRSLCPGLHTYRPSAHFPFHNIGPTPTRHNGWKNTKAGGPKRAACFVRLTGLVIELARFHSEAEKEPAQERGLEEHESRRPKRAACFVRLTGLEPAHRRTPDPKSGASTNSATGAGLWCFNVQNYTFFCRYTYFSLKKCRKRLKHLAASTNYCNFAKLFWGLNRSRSSAG